MEICWPQATHCIVVILIDNNKVRCSIPPPSHYKADPSYTLSDATSCATKIQIEYLNISSLMASEYLTFEVFISWHIVQSDFFQSDFHFI